MERAPNSLSSWASDLWCGAATRAQKLSPLPLLLHLTDTYILTIRPQVSCHFLQKSVSDLKVCHIPYLFIYF